MKKRRLLSIIGVSTVCLLASLAIGETTTKPAVKSPFAADAYLEHVKYLASDQLEGRRPGTKGIELAAEYIAKQFARAGLEPAGDSGTWFQTFEVRRGKKLVDEEAMLEVAGLDQKWRVRKDWIPLPFTETGEVEGPLAFAGYGIKAGVHEYNDYADFDATGKVLLIFRYEPLSDDPDADFGGKEPSHYSQFRHKARTASRQGAKALLIVNPPKREGLDEALYAFDEELSKATFDLPLVHVSRKLAQTLVKKAGLGDLESFQEQLDRKRQPLSADMNMTVRLRTGVQPNRVKTRNVIGLLKGDGSTDEIILVGAHYDHLGKVGPQWGGDDSTPKIHNGADDNASGTAGVIEMARMLGRQRGLRRNVLFTAFSAEEMGLLGSKHFVAHPTIDLEKARAMVNFDMIGRLGQNKFTIYGTPSGKELPDLVGCVAKRWEIEYRTAKGTPGNSDHAGFYEHGIPYLFAFTGVHKQYHRPEDDWERINAPGATQLLGMFHEIIRELANMEDGPTFQKHVAELEPEDLEMKPAREHEKEAQKAASKEKPAPPPDGGEVETHTGGKVRLGIIPDHAQMDQPGVVVDTALDGGAAKAAGMKAGDRIVRIADYEIKDIYGYMAALKSFKPGDKLDVVVIRDGKEVKLKVALTATKKRRGQD